MKIKNFDYLISSTDFDIIHQEKTYIDEKVVQSSELIFENNGTSTRIKFELAKGNEISENDFLFVPETNILFYRGMIKWCAFDLTNKCVIRNESATQLPFIERRNNVILIYDDLYAESTDLRAERIDNVPIDPPTESIDYDDRIEFESPVFGKQILKLSKTEIITYKFPGGMNADSSGKVDKILFELNQKITKGEKLAEFSNGNYEMEMTAEKDGIVCEILIEENQKIYQNDDLWKIKTTHNTVYKT